MALHSPANGQSIFPMSTQLRISGKHLGQLALPDFCPRCFWLQMRCGHKLPWLIFPGIFSSLDTYQKKITNLHFEQHRCIPRWLDGFGDLGKPTKMPGHKTFNVVDAETNIRLTGVPDEILRRDDGSLFVADYKTARYTGTQDELLPMYVVQLNSYSIIAERIGIGRIPCGQNTRLTSMLEIRPVTPKQPARLTADTTHRFDQMGGHWGLQGWRNQDRGNMIATHRNKHATAVSVRQAAWRW
jgi:hypothetical protein